VLLKKLKIKLNKEEKETFMGNLQSGDILIFEAGDN
jgi:hypothetical protein